MVVKGREALRSTWFLITLVSLTFAPWSAKADIDPKQKATSRTRGYQESPLNFGLELTYSPIAFNNYVLQPGTNATQAGNAFQITFEYLPMTQYGKLAVGLGSGFFFLQNAQLAAQQWASLYVLPIDVYVAYRFDYIKNQIVAPFVKLGGNTSFTLQNSATGGDIPGYQTYYGLIYSGGLEICLNAIDSGAARDLDGSAGINNTYLIVEVLQSSPLSKGNPNLGHTEYRFGLRFEM